VSCVVDGSHPLRQQATETECQAASIAMCVFFLKKIAICWSMDPIPCASKLHEQCQAAGWALVLFLYYIIFQKKIITL